MSEFYSESIRDKHRKDCEPNDCRCGLGNDWKPEYITYHELPKHRPTTYEQALDIVLVEMREIMLDRHRKYGAQNILRGGVHGLIIRIGDKLARIEEDHRECRLKYCIGESRDFPDEQTEDSWKDLANYAGPVGLMLQRGWWELPLTVPDLPLEENVCLNT